MQKKTKVLVTTVAAGIALVGSIAARKRGNGTVVSMGMARQPDPKDLGATPAERFTNGSEMPACMGNGRSDR